MDRSNDESIRMMAKADDAPAAPIVVAARRRVGRRSVRAGAARRPWAAASLVLAFILGGGHLLDAVPPPADGANANAAAFVEAWKRPFGGRRDGGTGGGGDGRPGGQRQQQHLAGNNAPKPNPKGGGGMFVDAADVRQNAGPPGQQPGNGPQPPVGQPGPAGANTGGGKPAGAKKPTLDQLLKKASTLPPLISPRTVATMKKVASECYDALPKSLTVTLPAALKAAVLYKPPVGIAALYLALRTLRLRGTGISVLDKRLRAEVGSKRRKWGRKRTKALDLDLGDSDYDAYGGAEGARSELCRAALRPYVEREERARKVRRGERLKKMLHTIGDGPAMRAGVWGAVAKTGQTVKHAGRSSMLEARRKSARFIGKDDLADRLEEEAARLQSEMTGAGEDDTQEGSVPCRSAAACAAEVLGLACPPRGAREAFVSRSVKPLACLFQTMDSCSIDAVPPAPPSADAAKGGTGVKKPDANLGAILLVASRTAELRTLDALLRISRDRLLASSSRLSRASSTAAFWVRWHTGGIFPDGVRSWLRKTLRGSTLEDDRRRLALARAAYRREVDRLGRVQGLLLGRPAEMGGEGLIDAALHNSTDKSRMGMTDLREEFVIGPEGAARVLLGGSSSGGGEKWGEEAAAWSGEARTLISDLIAEVEDPPEDESARLSEWAAGALGHDEECWLLVLMRLETLSKSRRAGEVRVTSLRDVQMWLRQSDLGGIPSAVATMALALWAHNFLAPRWDTIIDYSQNAGKAVWGIVDMRFWRPLRDIVLDLLNRRPRMLDPYALANEQRSLDNMLRDLGVGDGTPSGRAAAVAGASRLYEEELEAGAIRNLVRGRMIRLLLIQVQQLKSGLLQAMGSIDDLVDKNRLNVQLLAAIPAMLIFSYGTRFFFSAAFSLRTRSLRPKLLKDIQEDMNDCLRRIEWRLLTSGRGVGGTDDVTTEGAVGGAKTKAGAGAAAPSAVAAASAPLRRDELGEFALLIHSYLLLLEYASPPIPAKVTADIQGNIQQLLARGYEQGALQQLRLLGVIKEKNADLIKSYF